LEVKSTTLVLVSALTVFTVIGENKVNNIIDATIDDNNFLFLKRLNIKITPPSFF
jgi:hypothetical protein